MTHWSELCGMESGLLRRFLATSLPLVLTELVWVLGERVRRSLWSHGNRSTGGDDDDLPATGAEYRLALWSIGGHVRTDWSPFGGPATLPAPSHTPTA